MSNTTTSELQETRKQHSDVKVFTMDNTYGTYGTCVFVPLEEDGMRYNKGKKHCVKLMLKHRQSLVIWFFVANFAPKKKQCK